MPEQLKKRGRPKKVVESDNNLSSSVSKITYSQVSENWSKLFSSKYQGLDYLGALSTMYSLNPYVQNQRVKNIRTRAAQNSRDTIENAIKDPDYNELTLRQTSADLANTVYPYYKILKLYSDILTYKWTCTPCYVDKDNMKTPRFKSDSKIVDLFFKKLQPSYTFRRIALDVLREGKQAYYFRSSVVNDTGKESCEYATLQKLPSNWWKVVGITSDSYFQIAMNFMYFYQPGTSIDQFPPSFKKYYEELMNCVDKNKKGKITIDYDKVGKNATVECSHGNYYYWVTLPANEAFVFSADETTASQVPTFTGLFLGFSDIAEYIRLQQQLLSLPAYSVMSGKIPMGDAKNKSGSYVNDLTLSPDLILGYTDQFTQFAPAGIVPFFSPFEDMQLHNFPAVPNAMQISDSALQSSISTAGLTTILSTSEKPTVQMSKAGQTLEQRFSDFLYRQFENCVNIYLKKSIGLKYDWNFKMFGGVFTEQQELAAVEKSVSMGQTSLLPKYLAYHDITVEDAICTSDWLISTGIYDKMKTIVSSFNQKADSKKNGRPANDNPESEATANSQESGLNTSENRTFSIGICNKCASQSELINEFGLCPDCVEELLELES